METVPRAGWQHPGSRAASPPCRSRWARVGEPGSRAPHGPPGSPNAAEKSPASSPPQLCFPLGASRPCRAPQCHPRWSIPVCSSPGCPPWKICLTQARANGKLRMFNPDRPRGPGVGWAGGCEQRGERWGGEWRAAALHPRCIAQRCRTRPRAWRGTGGRCRADPLGIYYNLLFLRRWAAWAGSQLGQVSSTACPRAAAWAAPMGLLPCPPPPPGWDPPGSLAPPALPTRPIPPGQGMLGDGLQPGCPPRDSGALPPMALASCPRLGGEPQLLFLVFSLGGAPGVRTGTP